MMTATCDMGLLQYIIVVFVLAQTNMSIVEFRPEILGYQCKHMVQQALVLTKKGLWYKQMLDTRRSQLRKAEAEVFLS
jgi:hypothetical protein